MNQYVDLKSLTVGDTFPPVNYKPITKVQLVRYAGASGDFNPIHTDDESARQAGLNGVIAQGMLVMGFVGQAIAGWVPKRLLKRFKVRFKGMTFPGDVITVDASVADISETDEGKQLICEATAKDQNGEIKVAGQFEVLVSH